MANRRVCTNCGRSEPEITWISSSGNWCYFCVSELRLKEWRAGQEKREYFQWLQSCDGKPADMPRNRPTTGRGRE